MPRLRRRSATAAVLAAGLALGLSACGSNDPSVLVGAPSALPSTAASPIAKIDALTGVQTAVMLDPMFLAGLTALKLTPAMLGTATLTGSTVAFPITGGNVTYYNPSSGVQPYVKGEIDHRGSGMSLTSASGTVVKLEDFVVDPANSMLTGKVTVDGKLFAPSAPLFFLDGSTLQPLANGSAPGTAVLTGTTVSLTKTAADALNTVFKTTALKEYFPVGVAQITVNTGS